jgi:hypothetical protein
MDTRIDPLASICPFAWDRNGVKRHLNATFSVALGFPMKAQEDDNQLKISDSRLNEIS